MNEVEVDTACWSCGRGHKVITEVHAGCGCDEAPPDASICSACGAIGLLTDDMKIRQPTTEEMEELLSEQFVVDALFSVRQAIAMRVGDQ